MGYSTNFKGQLTFTQPLSEPQLERIRSMLHEDCRDHLEWGQPRLGYIDLELTPDRTGLQWDGSEKTYDLELLVNVVLTQMRKEWPEFSLVGAMVAQGDSIDDRWALSMGDDGWAHKVPIVVKAPSIVCPHCSQSIVLESA